MKNIWKIAAFAAAAYLLAACAPDYLEVSESGLPQASEFDVKVDVDQSTNYVTFNLGNQGMVPVWIFTAGDPIDNTSGAKVTDKQYAYVGNGITLRFRNSGEHAVEVKAYNANGVSLGSKVVNFSLSETYRDPFDDSPYLKALSGGESQTWAWNYEVDGHFGCGPMDDSSWGLGWWSCGANGKADWSLYDDRMTFTSDKQYTYDPGDGYVYVNSGSGYKSEYNTNGEDYLVPIEKYTTSYSIENSWNDAGIEEVYLVLPKGSNLSYIASQNSVDDPRYQFISTKQADIRKTLKLFLQTTSPANPDGISWHYEFVPESSLSQKEDPLYGVESKVWIMDADSQGHLACGPDQGNPAGWWSAGPHEKDGWGMYDDELTFYSNGKYTFSAGEDGVIYVNKDVTVEGNSVHDEDYNIQWPDQESTYTFDGEWLKFPAHTIIGYITNNDEYEDPTFYVSELTENRMVLVANGPGISWQYIFRPKDGQGPVLPPEPEDDTDWVLEGESNLWRGAEITMDTWYSGADWSGGVAPDYQILPNNGFSANIPEGVGGSEWMAQNKLITDIATTAETLYDFSATFTASEDMTITVKLTSNPEEDNDIHSFFYNGGVKLEAGVPFILKMPSIQQSVGSDNLMLIFDFGRSPIGSNIEVTDIIFQEHRSKSGNFDINGEGNLWKSASISLDTWYSGADWGGGVAPDCSVGANNSFTATIPEGVGGSEWMAQNKLISDIATSAETMYDFCCTFTADEDMTITCKLTSNPEEDNDIHSFFYNGGISLEAGVPYTLKMTSIQQSVGSANLMLIFDFGRSPIGSKIEVGDICFQVHK